MCHPGCLWKKNPIHPSALRPDARRRRIFPFSFRVCGIFICLCQLTPPTYILQMTSLSHGKKAKTNKQLFHARIIICIFLPFISFLSLSLAECKFAILLLIAGIMLTTASLLVNNQQPARTSCTRITIIFHGPDSPTILISI